MFKASVICRPSCFVNGAPWDHKTHSGDDRFIWNMSWGRTNVWTRPESRERGAHTVSLPTDSTFTCFRIFLVDISYWYRQSEINPEQACTLVAHFSTCFPVPPRTNQWAVMDRVSDHPTLFLTDNYTVPDTCEERHPRSRLTRKGVPICFCVSSSGRSREDNSSYCCK